MENKITNFEQKQQQQQQQKGFHLLRTDTIQLWVWLEGYQPLDDQSLKSLPEDIQYRIRENTDVKEHHLSIS
jgi:hypothetical protein